MEGGAPQDGLRVPVAEGDVLELYVHPSSRGRQRQRTRRILPPRTHASFMPASPPHRPRQRRDRRVAAVVISSFPYIESKHQKIF